MVTVASGHRSVLCPLLSSAQAATTINHSTVHHGCCSCRQSTTQRVCTLNSYEHSWPPYFGTAIQSNVEPSQFQDLLTHTYLIFFCLRVVARFFLKLSLNTKNLKYLISVNFQSTAQSVVFVFTILHNIITNLPLLYRKFGLAGTLGYKKQS